MNRIPFRKPPLFCEERTENFTPGISSLSARRIILANCGALIHSAGMVRPALPGRPRFE